MNGEDRLAQRALVAVAWTFVGCLVIQFFLVGLDVFEALGESQLHRDFAYTYGWLAPGIVLLGGLARVRRGTMALAVALLVLFAVQTYLPTINEAMPTLAALHAVNSLVVFWVAVRLAQSIPTESRAPGAAGR